MNTLAEGSAQRLAIGTLAFCLAAGAGVAMIKQPAAALSAPMPVCGNNICEAGERDEYFNTQSCMIMPSGECVPQEPHLVPGSCNSDCVSNKKLIDNRCMTMNCPAGYGCSNGQCIPPVVPISSAAFSSSFPSYSSAQSSSISSVQTNYQCLEIDCPAGYGCSNGRCIPPSSITQAPFEIDVAPPANAAKVEGVTASFWLKLSSWWNRLFSGGS
jgi:hypothetical protein